MEPEEGILTGEVSEEHDAEIRAEVDRQENEFLAKMETEDEEQATEARERDEHGRFKKKDAEEEAAVETKDTTEPSQEDSVNPEDYRAAVRAFQRLNVPDSAIEAIPKSELIERATEHLAAQKEQDGFGNKIRELERQLAERDKPKESTDSASAEPKVDPDLEPLLAKAELMHDEDTVQLLRAMAEKATAKARATTDAASEKIQQELDQLRATQLRQELNTARSQLADKWNLTDEIRYAKVEEGMRKLDGPNWSSIQELMDAAATLAFAGEDNQRLKANLASEHKHRQNGQSTPSKQAVKPDAPSTEDLEYKVFEGIIERDDEKRNRAARGLGKGSRPLSIVDLVGKAGE